MIESVSSSVPATPQHTAVPREVLEVAEQFEAIFVRQMLKSVEKVGGQGQNSQTSQQVYGSMIVNNLANSVAEGGGLGLKDVIVEALMAHSPGAPEK